MSLHTRTPATGPSLFSDSFHVKLPAGLHVRPEMHELPPQPQHLAHLVDVLVNAGVQVAHVDQRLAEHLLQKGFRALGDFVLAKVPVSDDARRDLGLVVDVALPAVVLAWRRERYIYRYVTATVKVTSHRYLFKLQINPGYFWLTHIMGSLIRIWGGQSDWAKSSIHTVIQIEYRVLKIGIANKFLNVDVCNF